MNVSAEEKSPGQQQQPPVDAPGNDPIENLGKKEENETKDQIAAKAVNSEQNGGENKTKESKEDDSANDKDKKGTEQGTGVDTAKEEPSEEDLKSMPVRQYLETTVVGIIMQGMQQLVRKRPDDPIAWLSDFLDRNNPKKRKFDQMEEDPATAQLQS